MTNPSFIPSLLHPSPPPHLHRSSLIPNPNNDSPQIEDEKDDDDDGTTTEDLDADFGFPSEPVSHAQLHHDSSFDRSTSSDADVRHSRIHQELSHEFLARQKTPFLTKTVEILSHSSLLNRSPQEQPQLANGHSRHQHVDVPHTADLHLFEARQNLPDLKLDHRSSAVNGGSKGCIKSGGQKNAPGSARFRPLDGSSHENATIGKSPTRNIAHNIVRNSQKNNEALAEMFPVRSLMDSYEENSRANFQRHASMVYTRAPSREELARKVADMKKATKAGRRINKKDETAICEEQKDFVRHVHTDTTLSPQKLSSDNVLEILKLQDQVSELKRILATRESMSEICLSKKDDEQTDKLNALSLRIEELQQELAEKDLQWRSATETLQIKENEIQMMQDQLQYTEEKCTLLTTMNASNEKELQLLRCEIAALLWQIDIDIEREQREAKTEEASKEPHCNSGFQLKNLMDSGGVSKMEMIRKMYLAAVAVAKHVANEECLTLLSLLRIELQHILESNLW